MSSVPSTTGVHQAGRRGGKRRSGRWVRPCSRTLPCRRPTCSPGPAACNFTDWHVPTKETVSRGDAVVPGQSQNSTYHKWCTGEDSDAMQRSAVSVTPHHDRSGLLRRQWPRSQYSQGNKTSPFKHPSPLPRSVALHWVFHSSGVSVI